MYSRARPALLAAGLLIGLLFCLVVNGALPLFTMPTLGQALWTTGFSQSFLNESLLNIYARNIGAPEPAAIAFGLAGAWSAAGFMRLGLSPADAYSAMVALWLTVAFVAAYRLGRYWSAPAPLAALAAVCWGTMPLIWAHAGYSMVSLGLALLPLYFLAAVRLFLPRRPTLQGNGMASGGLVAGHVGVAIVAVFMDGYSFMMFAAGGGLLAAWLALADPLRRSWLLRVAIPGHVVGLGVAYGLYTLYLGKPHFEPSHLDFFRGWGVDVTFLIIPSQGVLWLPDALGWSVHRTQQTFFGDSSVWRTTFSLPLIVGGIWAAIFASGRRPVVLGLVFVSAFGFYMALGPSLKIHSTKPQSEQLGPTMDAKYALAPTGSALLSAHLPGFNNMRASYRWQALGAFSAWALLLLVMSRPEPRLRSTAAAALCLVIVFNVPNLPEKLRADANFRTRFLEIDAELVQSLREVLTPSERVAFLPWQNDFLATYLAPALDAVAFNMGGDKNLAEARKHWPQTMREFPRAYVDENFASRVLVLLAREEAQVVVLSHIDMGRSAFEWPPSPAYQQALEPAIEELESSRYVDVERRQRYAVVRLKPEFASLAGRDALAVRIATELCLPPQCLQRKHFGESDHSLIGRLHEGAIHTTGTAGFLHYGPYAPMAAGDYLLAVRGIARRSASSWVDVTSGRGMVRHAYQSVSPHRPDEGTLALIRFRLDSPVDDLEIRLHVGDQTDLTLHGYQLEPTITLD